MLPGWKLINIPANHMHSIIFICHHISNAHRGRPISYKHFIFIGAIARRAHPKIHTLSHIFAILQFCAPANLNFIQSPYVTQRRYRRRQETDVRVTSSKKQIQIQIQKRGGVWEKDFTTSNNFGRLKPLDLGVGRVEIWWEEREGRGESGEGKVSSIMRVVGGWPHLRHAPGYQWRTRIGYATYVSSIGGVWYAMDIQAIIFFVSNCFVIQKFCTSKKLMVTNK